MSAEGTGAPCSGIARTKPTPMPITVPSTRRKLRTRVSPLDAVFTKTHQVAPTAQYQRSWDSTCPRASAKAPPATAWTACRVVVRASPVPPGAGGAAGTGRRRS